MGGDGGSGAISDISLSRQEKEKVSNITTDPAICQCVLGAQGNHSLIDWITLACRDAWPMRRISLGMWAYGKL